MLFDNSLLIEKIQFFSSVKQAKKAQWECTKEVARQSNFCTVKQYYCSTKYFYVYGQIFVVGGGGGFLFFVVFFLIKKELGLWNSMCSSLKEEKMLHVLGV